MPDHACRGPHASHLLLLPHPTNPHLSASIVCHGTHPDAFLCCHRIFLLLLFRFLFFSSLDAAFSLPSLCAIAHAAFAARRLLGLAAFGRGRAGFVLSAQPHNHPLVIFASNHHHHHDLLAPPALLAAIAFAVDIDDFYHVLHLSAERDRSGFCFFIVVIFTARRGQDHDHPHDGTDPDPDAQSGVAERRAPRPELHVLRRRREEPERDRAVADGPGHHDDEEGAARSGLRREAGAVP